MWTRKKGMELLHETFGGELVEGSWGQGPIMLLPYKNWQIIMDYFVVSTGQSAITYTRVRTAFKNNSDFEFKVSKEGVFSKIGKALGGQDIPIGDEAFDSQYIVKSNDDLIVTRLLNNHEIKTKINFQKAFHLDLVKKNQMGIKCVEGESGLSFLTAHTLKDEAEIKELIDLFAAFLDVLFEQKVITDEASVTSLYKEKK